MSASDQDTQAAEPPEAAEAPASDGTGERTSPGTPRKSPEPAGTPRSEQAGEKAEFEEPESPEGAGAVHGSERGHPDEAREEAGEGESEEASAPAAGLTPKQARRLRVAVASVLLVAMAVVLAIRLASRTSVLVVGVYGLAMILCGVVIELSRNGRTRLATWLLVGGLLTALALDWLVLP
ncbi:hypothetical protein ACIRQY_09795 [Streptomyces sp. NPDC101490]|uniref:hypothetical protein n=1 Tax=Streptomyces sp. NPDC101490 TaxID=3366143 RepID=UPI00380DED6D